MLTVYQMLLKNRFLNGIGSGIDKTLNHTRPKPNSLLCFTGDCLSFDYCSETYQQKTITPTGTETLNFSSTKPGVGLVLCARGFDSTKPNFELKTAKSDKFMEIFTSCVLL